MHRLSFPPRTLALLTLALLTGLPSANAQTTYWLPARNVSDTGTTYSYETKAPDYFADWLKKLTPIGGGSIVTKTINGQTYRFVKQTFSWAKPLQNAVNIETIATPDGFGGGKWEFNGDLKNQNGVIAALTSHVIQSTATHEKAEILALIHEGETPPGLVYTESMIPYDSSAEARLYAAPGSPPEIVAFPNADGSVDVAWQNYLGEKASGSGVATNAKRAIYIHRLPNGKQEAELLTMISTSSSAGPRSLGMLAGFTKDDEGNFYVLTVVDEKVTPADKGYVYRKNIINLIKLNSAGDFMWQSDLNEEGKVIQPIYAPLVAGTARLVFGTIQGVDLIYVQYMASDGPWDHSINTRHQHSDWCLVDAKTGDAPTVKELSATSGRGSHGHSFDLRAIFDEKAEQFVVTEASDASFTVTIDQPLQSGHQYTKDGVTAVVVNNKRGQAPGANDYFMELGGVASVSDGYLVLAARQLAENRPFELLAKKMPRDFWGKYLNDMESWNQEREGTPTKLTEELGDGKAGAVRPKLVKVDNDDFVVVFERWKDNGYQNTHAMKISSDGSIKMAPKQLEGTLRLHRGDDAFALPEGGKTCAAWVTGNSGTLVLHMVCPNSMEHTKTEFVFGGAQPKPKAAGQLVEGTTLPLPPGQLVQGTRYYTADGSRFLKFADDGNVVVARVADDQYLWGLNARPGVDYQKAASVRVTPEGRFEVLDAGGSLIWSIPDRPVPGNLLDLTTYGVPLMKTRGAPVKSYKLPLPAGTTIQQGERYVSEDGKYYLFHAGFDNNLMVVRTEDDGFVWGLNEFTDIDYRQAAVVRVVPEGRMDVLDGTGKVILSVHGKPGQSLGIHPDGHPSFK